MGLYKNLGVTHERGGVIHEKKFSGGGYTPDITQKNFLCNVWCFATGSSYKTPGWRYPIAHFRSAGDSQVSHWRPAEPGILAEDRDSEAVETTEPQQGPDCKLE